MNWCANWQTAYNMFWNIMKFFQGGVLLLFENVKQECPETDTEELPQQAVVEKEELPETDGEDLPQKPEEYVQILKLQHIL